MKTKHYLIINPILCINSVLKVAREVAADAKKQPKDDHICNDEDDVANDDQQVRRGEVK